MCTKGNLMGSLELCHHKQEGPEDRRESWSRILPHILRGAWSRCLLNYRLLASRVMIGSISCSQPPSSWYFFTPPQGNHFGESIRNLAWWEAGPSYPRGIQMGSAWLRPHITLRPLFKRELSPPSPQWTGRINRNSRHTGAFCWGSSFSCLVHGYYWWHTIVDVTHKIGYKRRAVSFLIPLM